MHDHHSNQKCIDACVRCAREAEHCASACENEADAYLRTECIRLNKDCAEICWTAAAYLLRESQFQDELCRLCTEVCTACATECDRFPEEHCVHCASACWTCADECRRMATPTVVMAT